MTRFSPAGPLVAALAALLFLPACLALKSYEEPEVDVDNLYGLEEEIQLDSTTLADMPWESFFDDPVLRDLIAEALRYNLDLRDAIQQIRIAEADFYEGRLALYPDLQADASAAYNNQSDNAVNFGNAAGGSGGNGGEGDGGGEETGGGVSIPPTTQYSASLSSSWQADIWGQLTSAKRAAFASLLQTEASTRAVQTTLIADVAIGYYQLLALDRQLEITRETVENRASDLETVRALKQGALLTSVDVQQSRANLFAARVEIPALQQQIIEQENALSLLLGRKMSDVERTSLLEQDPLDTLATGVPAQLLRNRPDVIAAEYQFRSAFALTNNARTFFYPSLTLTAEGGLQSLDFADFFKNGSIFYNLVAGVTQPIFARGQNEARLRRREAQQQQARLDLRRSLLQAGEDVSNALNQYENAGQSLAYRAEQLDALEQAVGDARQLLRFGEANYVQVLTVQQALLSARLNRVNDRLDRLRASVNLYQALGGGWDQEENPIAEETEESDAVDATPVEAEGNAEEPGEN